MSNKIQSKFINVENGTLYYEIYFNILSVKDIDYNEYKRIQDIIYNELEKGLKLKEENTL